MNRRQMKFVAAYLKSGNATEAAIAAGYAKKTARQIGSRLLTYVDVQALLTKANEKTITSAVLTVAERKAMLSESARQAHAGLKPFLVSCTPDGDLSFDINPENIHGEIEQIEQHIKPAPEGSGEADTVVRKIKVRNALPYIQELNKMDGEYAPEKTEVEVTGDAITAALERIAQRRKEREKKNRMSQ